jgi:hypothetical protein
MGSVVSKRRVRSLLLIIPSRADDVPVHSDMSGAGDELQAASGLRRQNDRSTRSVAGDLKRLIKDVVPGIFARHQNELGAGRRRADDCLQVIRGLHSYLRHAGLPRLAGAPQPAQGSALHASAARRLSSPDALSLLRPHSASRGPKHLVRAEGCGHCPRCGL